MGDSFGSSLPTSGTVGNGNCQETGNYVSNLTSFCESKCIKEL